MARTLFGEELESLTYKTLKNSDFREVSLEREGKTVLKFAIANGFRNIQNLVQKLKRKRCDYDFVEVIAIVSSVQETLSEFPTNRTYELSSLKDSFQPSCTRHNVR